MMVFAIIALDKDAFIFFQNEIFTLWNITLKPYQAIFLTY